MSVEKFLLNLGAVFAAVSLIYTSFQIIKADFVLSEFIAAPCLFYALGTMFFVQNFKELEKKLTQKEIALNAKAKEEKTTIKELFAENDMIRVENDKLKNEIQSLRFQIRSLEVELDEVEIKYKAAYKVGREHYQDLQELKKQNRRRKF